MERTHPLPPPLQQEYAWQHQGACRQGDPELFFHESERGRTRQQKVASAKAICADCPVIQECLEHGVSAQEPYGIWGGLTVEERRSELRRRQRAQSWS